MRIDSGHRATIGHAVVTRPYHNDKPARLHFQAYGTRAMCARVVGEVLCDIRMPGFDFAGRTQKPSPPAQQCFRQLCGPVVTSLQMEMTKTDVVVQKNHGKGLYIVASIVLIVLGVAFGSTKNPYGQHFFTIVVPGLAILNCFQWFVISVGARWRGVGMLISLAAALVLSLVYHKTSTVTFYTVFVVVVSVHGIVLWNLASAWTERSVVLAEHLTIGFVLLLGTDLNLRGIGLELNSSHLGTVGFLFWVPIFIPLLWAGGVAFRSDRAIQVFLLCAIAQVGIGLFDLGAGWGIAWGLPAAISVWLGALGLAAYLARTWGSQSAMKRR